MQSIEENRFFVVQLLFSKTKTQTMKKVILSLALVLAMGVSLTSCRETKKEETATEEAVEQVEEAVEETGEAMEEAAEEAGEAMDEAAEEVEETTEEVIDTTSQE